MRFAFLVLITIANLVAPTNLVAAAPATLRKVHVLLVIDSNDSNLAPSVEIDKRRMIHHWRTTVPAKLYELTVLEGRKATRAGVLEYYRALSARRDEGLVFFYAGHGARDQATGIPYFDFAKGGPMPREELVRVMEAKRTALVLLMTDCCSTRQSFRESLVNSRAVIPSSPTTARRLHPTMRALVFQARGTIDVTAATDNASWGDPEKGGLFTRSLCKMLATPVRSLDANQDGTVTWREFFPQLRAETATLFGTWRKEMTARGERVDERKQIPLAYRLGRR